MHVGSLQTVKLCAHMTDSDASSLHRVLTYSSVGRRGRPESHLYPHWAILG